MAKNQICSRQYIKNTILVQLSKKSVGSVVIPYVDPSPFFMNVSSMSLNDAGCFTLNITLSHAGKVICTLVDPGTPVKNLSFYGNSRSTNYFPTNLSIVNDFCPILSMGKRQLYCKAISLYKNDGREDYFLSEPFYLSCKNGQTTLV